MQKRSSDSGGRAAGCSLLQVLKGGLLLELESSALLQCLNDKRRLYHYFGYKSPLLHSDKTKMMKHDRKLDQCSV